MVKAYILMVVDAGKEINARDELLKMDFVEEAEIVYGEFDVVCKVNAKDLKELASTIIDKIRRVPGVNLTSTMIIAEK